MMKSKIYFLNGLLPELSLDSPPELGFLEIHHLLKTNLSSRDYEQVESMRRYYDLENLRATWRKEEISYYGNFDEQELEEALLTYSGLPDYVYDFLQRRGDTTSRLMHFGELLIHYYEQEASKATGFLKSFFLLGRTWRLVTAACRARASHRSLRAELRDVNPEDPVVSSLLAQSEISRLIPPEGYEALAALWDSDLSPLERHRKTVEWRFQMIGEMVEVETFSFDRILAFLARLILVEQWQALSKEKGVAIVDTMIKESS